MNILILNQNLTRFLILKRTLKLFFSTTNITSSLADKYYVTDSNGRNKYKSHLTAIDPLQQPQTREYALSQTKILLNYGISNGEFHSVN